MKLRNKKTGEIVELKLIEVNDKYLEDHEVSMLNGEKLTLESLVNSFDDVKEPLIKDEKIRKCVKLWLEINEIYSVTYRKRRGGGSYLELDNMPMRNGCCIIFQDLIEELEDEQVYTFDELCGEGEE